MPEHIGYSVATGETIDDTWRLFSLGADAATGPRSLALPARVRLDGLAVHLTGLSGSPTECTMFLAREVDGGTKLTPSNTSGATAALDYLDGSSTEADVVWDLDDLAVVFEAADVPTLGLKLDTGSGTSVVGRLTWRRGQ